MVDLAGSERLGKTGVSRANLQEWGGLPTSHRLCGVEPVYMHFPEGKQPEVGCSEEESLEVEQQLQSLVCIA